MFGGLTDIFFSDTFPVFDKSMCLNRRNRFEPCNLCEKVCKSKAVNINSGLIFIEDTKCISCGLCASICPSEAIKLRDYQIFRAIAGNDEIKCQKIGGLYCIKALNPAFLVSIIIMKPEIKFIIPCENCELAENISKNNLDIALKFLDALKIQQNIQIISDENFESEISRRELMSSFFTWGKNKSSNILENVIWHNKNDIFLSREFLVDKLADTNAKINSGVFFDFDVSENCTACGLCEAMCPSGAWKISKLNEKAKLIFDTTKCSGCMLCVKKCPEKSIILLKNFYWPIINKIKKEFSMIRCRHCGRWFIKNELEQDLCASCSENK